MNDNNCRQRLPKTARYAGWIIILFIIFYHIAPFWRGYEIPHGDYFRVMHIINYLRDPVLYGGDNYSKTLSEFGIVTTPVYFYALTYPLSLVLSAKQTMLTIGTTITVISTYFAGDNWRNWNNLITAIVVLLILLHIFINPLEGNRRSFTALFILGLLWTEKNRGYLSILFMVALASGIYPPMALLMLTYLGLRYLFQLFIEYSTTMRNVIFKISSLVLTFVVVLTPYIRDLLVNAGQSQETFSYDSLHYKFGSFHKAFETFIEGSPSSLFNYQIHFDVFVIFLFLNLCFFLLLKNDYVIQKRYLFLFASGLILWILAHLFYPLIYKPFKYTRLSLLMALILPVCEQSITAIRKSQNYLSKSRLLRISIYIVAVIFLIFWILMRSADVNFEYIQTYTFIGETGWNFLLVLPVILTFILLLKQFPEFQSITPILVPVLLILFLFIPHKEHSEAGVYQWRGLKLNDFAGMYSFLRNTEPGSKVAGPPIFYMDPIRSFGQRPIYASHNLATHEGGCKRLRKFWPAYFSPRAYDIVQFMYDNNIEYLLIDRRIYREQMPAAVKMCGRKNAQILQKSLQQPNYFLNQHFEEASWKLDRRLYLLTSETIMNKF